MQFDPHVALGLDWRKLLEEEHQRRRYDWAKNARPEQLPPPGDWRFWLILAGRGWGKTRVIAEYTRMLAQGGKHGRIALLGATAADVRDVIVEGDSGILSVSPPDFMPLYEPSKRQLSWPNGVIAKTYSADEPDRLRGPQHHAAIVDELAAYEYPEAFTQLKFGLRLGKDIRCAIATTPKPCFSVRELVKQSKEGNGRVIITRGSTYDNRANLAPEFFEEIIKQYEGTRLGRQELDGELLEDTPGALWNTLILDRTRVRPEDAPEMARVVISVDPSVTSSEDSDECGLVVCGKGFDGDGYIIADRSGVMSPHEWATAAIKAYHEFGADVIVAETNNGGDLVGNTLLALDPSIAFRKVVASRGKHLRAEPVSAKWEQGQAHLIGNYAQLEEQMCAMASDGYTGKGSPDRCFIAGTLIRTPRGEVPIESLRIGDFVMTRFGPRPIVDAGSTGRREVRTVEFSSGSSLTATVNHPLFVKKKGFIALDALVYGDIISTWRETKSRLTGLSSTGTRTLPKGLTGCITRRTSRQGWRAANQASTGICGRGRMAPSQRAALSTIKTRTPRTTLSRISSVLPGRGTGPSTVQKWPILAGQTLRRLERQPVSGTGRLLVSSGTASTGLKRGSAEKPCRWDRARFVEPNASDSIPSVSARESASRNITATTRHTGRSAYARCAPSRLRSMRGSRRSHAPVSVVGFYDAGKARVYNLTVAGAHEYFANGVLVHNCDAMVHGLTELLLGEGGMVQMFPDFRAAPRTNEPVNARHVDAEPLKEWWPRWVSVTVGGASAAHWWCRNPNGRLHIYREHLAVDQTPEQFGAAIAEKSRAEAAATRMVPVWMSEKAFDRVNGKSIGYSLAEGIQRSLGEHKSFLFTHTDVERAVADPIQRYRAIEARLDRMPKGFLSVQALPGKDQTGWDVVRELLRWRSKDPQAAQEAPDWDHARQLAAVNMDEYFAYMSRFVEKPSEVRPLLWISPDCRALIQAMSGATRSEKDESALAQNGASFVLQSLRIGALASREEQGKPPMETFIGERMDRLRDDAPALSRHMAAEKAESDYNKQFKSEPITFRRVRR